ncbi:hypothetical protein JL722_13816 [Aureococcus anophagefferens]|nr:hypothetical protein JL722_13816 [Aureococcus anophagefferens]
MTGDRPVPLAAARDTRCSKGELRGAGALDGGRQAPIDQAALLQQMLDEEIMLTADNGVRVGNAFARRDGSPSRQLVALRGEGGSWCVRCDVCNIANILAVGKLRDPSADLRDIASQAKRHVGAWKSLLNHRPVREHWRQLALITGLALPVPAAPEPKPRSMKRDLRGTLPPRDDAPHGPETRVRRSNRRSDMGAAFRKKKRREHRRTSYAVPPPEGVVAEPEDVGPGGDTTGLLRAKGGTFKCSICPPGAPKRGNAYPEHAPNPWTTTCGVCEAPLGAPPDAGAVDGADAVAVLGCARCPRAFHERCLGLVSAGPGRYRHDLPWVDARGHWLCGACEGVGDAKAGMLDTASAFALSSMKRAAPVRDDARAPDSDDDDLGVPEPPPTQRAPPRATKTVLDALLGHDFGRRAVRALWRDAKGATGDDGPATRKMAKELGTPAELGFARCVRFHLSPADQAHLDAHVRDHVRAEAA